MRLHSCEGFSAVRSDRQPLWSGQQLGARSPGADVLRGSWFRVACSLGAGGPGVDALGGSWLGVACTLE